MSDQRVRAFFQAYETRVNRALKEQPEIDIEGTAGAYTECFMEAHPGGVMCFQNDDQFRSAVPQLFESQRRLGAKSMTIADLTLTPLNDNHTSVKVRWNAHYRLQDGRDIRLELDEIYFVQVRDGEPKIFAYIAGDQDQLLKAHGVIPAE